MPVRIRAELLCQQTSSYTEQHRGTATTLGLKHPLSCTFRGVVWCWHGTMAQKSENMDLQGLHCPCQPTSWDWFRRSGTQPRSQKLDSPPCFEKAWSTYASNLSCFMTLGKLPISLSLNCLNVATSWRSEKVETWWANYGMDFKSPVQVGLGGMACFLYPLF